MNKTVAFLLPLFFAACLVFAENIVDKVQVFINLPSPEIKGKISLEETIAKRRSIRNYSDEKLSLKELGQLLWAAQGITAGWGGRTVPSAGATYPLEIYVAAGNVDFLKPGLYHYKPGYHNLEKILDGDIRKKLCDAALGQKWIEKAPATIIIAADFSRTRKRYGERGTRYVFIEAGHAGQNIYLQSEALGLGTVAIGAFDDNQIQDILKIKNDVLYLMPVGKKP
ncbi:MAG: SagB/ThcOx family dehydrogenase [Candidatus Omnitrophica bacterium]|nr:SagB/ThcOx family dehydrogenase [Candidatus Omnitrophota bacterium]